MIHTLDQLGATEGHPITAEHGASTVSERYGFISTRTLLDNLANEGFHPRNVQVARVNSDDRRGYQRHLVRLQHGDLMKPIAVGEVVPEIVLMNSHDARSSCRMMLGLFRKICSNGMVVEEASIGHRFIHRDITIARVNEAALELTRQVPLLVERVGAMKARRMSATEAARFVRGAAQLRWEDKKQAQEAAINLARPRRSEDGQDTLWQVFNRVQENIITGARGIRRVTSIKSNVSVNQGLWSLAASYLN